MDGDSNLMDANFVEANFMASERDANCTAAEQFPALHFHSFQISANTKSPTINYKRLEVVSVSGLLQRTNQIAI